MKSSPSTLCLSLGSNIAPERNLAIALSELKSQFSVLAVSHFWQTSAVGSDGPDFINAAILVSSFQAPQWLKEQIIRPLETRLGRVRTQDKNAPRPIDVDIVVKGDQPYDDNLWNFVHLAAPVAELLPDLRSPWTGERLENAARRLMGAASPILRRDILFQPFLFSLPKYEPAFPCCSS